MNDWSAAWPKPHIYGNSPGRRLRVADARARAGLYAVALLTLALGIGANSAIFSVVNGVLFRGLPYRDADRLYRVQMLYPDGTAYTALSAPDFMSVRQDARVFDQVEAYSTGIFTLLGSGEPKEVRGATVSDGLFTMLGLPLAVGRGFAREEHQPGRGAVTVLDYGFWLREFGGDRSAVGRTVKVGGTPYTIVGCARPRRAAVIGGGYVRAAGVPGAVQCVNGHRTAVGILAVIGHAKPGIDSPTW
jgi:hypothetical protein